MTMEGKGLATLNAANGRADISLTRIYLPFAMVLAFGSGGTVARNTPPAQS